MTTTMFDGVDESRLEEFLGRAVVDLAAAESAIACYVGDRLGLYQALADGTARTAGEVAAATGTNERLVLEWLRNQTAGGYVEHTDGRFALTPEQALALAHTDSPAYLGGAFEILASVWADTDRIEAAFRGDGGLDWGDRDHRLYHGVERFYAPGYRGNLVSTWLPALDGVVDRLASGARVADVGCGYGLTTVMMAQAFPDSTFVGYDVHEASIHAAQLRAKEAGVWDRVTFEVLDAAEVPAREFDLVCMFDALHDMGDPGAAARAARTALNDDGVLMVVEPRAGDDLEANSNPVGRMFYAGSTLICTPAALAQHGPHALGAQAGPAVLTEILEASGFEDVRVVAETPFNIVLQGR